MKKYYLPLICVLLFTACGGSDTEDEATQATETGAAVKLNTDDDEKSIGTKKYRMALPEGGEDKYTDIDHGKETWFAISAITGINEVNANGVTSSHYFSDGTYRHGMQLNIEHAEDGYFYEGWIVAPGEDPISTGHLRSHFGDSRHFLNFESDEDLREYLKVVVTLEPDDGDPSPAGHIAEATLKVTERR